MRPFVKLLWPLVIIIIIIIIVVLVVACRCVGGYCRTSTMTTGIYVRNTGACRCTRRLRPAARCCLPSPPGYCTSPRRPTRRHPVPPDFRTPRRPRPGRCDLGRRWARWRSRGRPPSTTIANITHSAAPCVPSASVPDLASTAVRRHALTNLHTTPDQRLSIHLAMRNATKIHSAILQNRSSQIYATRNSIRYDTIR